MKLTNKLEKSFKNLNIGRISDGNKKTKIKKIHSKIPRNKKILKKEKQELLATQIQLDLEKEKYSDLITAFDPAIKKGIISLQNLIKIVQIYPDTKEAVKNIIDHINLINKLK